MAVRFLFFAQSARWMGTRELTISLKKPAVVSKLLKMEKLKPLKAYLGVFRVAINQEFARDLALVHDGDEVAILPPVSGG